MHEMGLCDALLKMVDGIIADEEVEQVQSITVEIGDLSGVVPRFMTDCWDAVVARTKYENTKLIIETVRGKLRCEDCGTIFMANLEQLICPQCTGYKLTPIAGQEMTLKEILC